MKTFITTKAYSNEFKSITKSGWGCGYVHIPKDHPFLVQLVQQDDCYFYLEPENCPEEITLSEWNVDKEYYTIGFDTAHGYNNESHDEEYVTRKTNEIKKLVDAYTKEDADSFARKEIEILTNKFKKYLL